MQRELAEQCQQREVLDDGAERIGEQAGQADGSDRAVQRDDRRLRSPQPATGCRVQRQQRERQIETGATEQQQPGERAVDTELSQQREPGGSAACSCKRFATIRPSR
ncbi:MAG TPA: hypothetical protein PKC26_10920, partial [Plasticicumulans sp.]|nr:hypothetical protein [Plasticicumulans sp.]